MLLFGLWWITDQTIRETFAASARESVDVDLAGLADIHASGGREELERRIADRLAMIPANGGRPHYLLVDGAGRILAGDLARWPDLDPAISESGTITIGSNSTAFGRATLLAEDLRLIVAHEPPDRSEILRRVGWVFLLGGVVFVACIAVFAQSASVRVRARVSRVSEAFRQGDEAVLERLAAPQRPDEIDRIASQAAEAVRHARNLMQAYRETSEQIAHEIRTPLMHLDSRIVKALAKQPDAAASAHLVEARSEIRRLVDLLEALLDIASSKAQSGDVRGLTTVNLSALVEQICELYQDSAEEAGYALRWNVSPSVFITGDEAQLGRILTNLLDNAFKYNRPGGIIDVTLEPGPRLVVVDEGPGIPPDEREKVFERFYRGRAVSGDVQGSGMGLALARAIAERHGLSLVLEESDSGAQFVLARA